MSIKADLILPKILFRFLLIGKNVFSPVCSDIMKYSCLAIQTDKRNATVFLCQWFYRNVETGYLLYLSKWIIATMLFASSIIVVCD